MAQEISDGDLDKLRKQNDDYRQKIAEEQQKLADAQQKRSRANDKALLEQEQERLKKQLDDAKEATKSLTQLNTPFEQVQAETADAAKPAATQGSGQE